MLPAVTVPNSSERAPSMTKISSSPTWRWSGGFASGSIRVMTARRFVAESSQMLFIRSPGWRSCHGRSLTAMISDIGALVTLMSASRERRTPPQVERECPIWSGASSPRSAPKTLGRPRLRREPAADEVAHQRDGPLGVRRGLLDEAVARAREVNALDLAAGLLPGAHERLGDRRRHVVVELRLGHPRRRQRASLAGLDDAGDTRRGHRRLVLE